MRKKIVGLFKTVSLILITLLITVGAYSQTCEVTLRNDSLIDANNLIVDIYVKATSGSFYYSWGQYKVTFNSAGIINGGAITGSIVPGYSDLTNSTQVPTTVYISSTYWRIPAEAIPSTQSACSQISASGLGTRICRVKLTNTASFAENPANMQIVATAPNASAIYYSDAGGYSNPVTSTMVNTNLINPILNGTLNSYNVTGTGPTPQNVGLDGSQTGVNYQLYKNSTIYGSPVTGTGSSISFGSQTEGTYTIKAHRIATYMYSDMAGSAVVSPPLPTAFNLTGGGSYCEGTGGVAIGLDDSENGVTYKLYRNTTILVSTISGTGSAISFGNQTTGTYTATGTNVTGTTNMLGSKTVTENPNATINLTSGNNNQTVCVNSSITNIIYTIGGGGTGAGVTGLPTGLNGSFSAGTFTITGTPSVSGTFPYTVTTTGTCTQTSANGTITVKAVQVPNAGPDQIGSAMCGLTSTTLAANTPTEGTGSWSIVSGTGGNIASLNSPSSTFTGTSGTTYVLRWTITNSPCAALYDEVTITFLQNPTIANAGPDQTGSSMCGLTSTTLAGNTPAVGAGTWSIISGSGGNIASPSNPASTFTGIAGSTYVLRWTIANSPCTATYDDVIITFAQNPTTANAGPDQTDASMCGRTSTTLAGNSPTTGTGTWSIISGAGGSISSANNPASNFSGTPGVTYVLRWTISNPPCTSTYDEVTVTFLQNPTIANAGPDQTGASMCGKTSTTLAANSPTVGTGSWSIVSGTGGSIASESNPASTFTGIAGTTYVLRWTISNPPCTASTDDVTITFAQNPTTANAGPDQTGSSMCGLTSTSLAANTPAVGT